MGRKEESASRSKDPPRGAVPVHLAMEDSQRFVASLLSPERPSPLLQKVAEQCRLLLG